MLRTFGRIFRASIKHQLGVLINHLLALCVHQPEHNTAGRLLLQTGLVRVQGGS
jgi:hypothetical protein